MTRDRRLAQVRQEEIYGIKKEIKSLEGKIADKKVFLEGTFGIGVYRYGEHKKELFKLEEELRLLRARLESLEHAPVEQQPQLVEAVA